MWKQGAKILSSYNVRSFWDWIVDFMLLYCNPKNAMYLLLSYCGNVYRVVVLGYKVYMLIITLWLSSWGHAYLLLLWSLNVRFHISSVWLHISQLLYFHNRARWAIKVTICPLKQPPLYGYITTMSIAKEVVWNLITPCIVTLRLLSFDLLYTWFLFPTTRKEVGK